MSTESLAEQVQRDTYSGQVAFRRLDEALNMILPGGDTHKRYRDIEAVGLATVIAQDSDQPGSYNPLESSTPERISFMADNRLIHPGAWTPLEADPEILGGAMPEGMGRFTAFALAKINTLTADKRLRSSIADRLSISPGSVGFAGGRRLGGGLLVAASGLWEVHDHVAISVYTDEVARELDDNAFGRTADTLAGEIEPIFDQIKSHQEGVEAADLDRNSLPDLLLTVDGLLLELKLRQNKTQEH